MAKKPDPKKSPKDKQKGAQNGKPKKAEQELQVPIEHNFGAGVLPIFSNHFVVRSEAGMFHLYFFHTQGPMILVEDEKERRELLSQIKSVPSNCLAHIVVTLDEYQKIMGAMAVNFTKFQNKQQTAQTSGE